jgi:hypothetical protein
MTAGDPACPGDEQPLAAQPGRLGGLVSEGHELASVEGRGHGVTDGSILADRFEDVTVLAPLRPIPSLR